MNTFLFKRYTGIKFLNKAPISLPIFLVRPISETANYIDVYALEGATDSDGDDLIISDASVTQGNVIIVRNDSHVRINFGANESSDVVVSYTIMDNGNPERTSTNTITVLSYSDNVLDYNPYHAWNSENVTVDGTTTTLADINNVGTTIDLSNPTAATQPTLNASNSAFNNLPSILFDGVSQYVSKAGKFRENDTSGVILSVFKKMGGLYVVPIAIGESTSNASYFNLNQIKNKKHRFAGTSAPTSRIVIDGTIEVDESVANVFSIASTGSAYRMTVNGVQDTVKTVFTLGTEHYWINTHSDWDSVSIGACISADIRYSNLEWAFTGYFPYVNDWEVIKAAYSLKDKYGI